MLSWLLKLILPAALPDLFTWFGQYLAKLGANAVLVQEYNAFVSSMQSKGLMAVTAAEQFKNQDPSRDPQPAPLTPKPDSQEVKP